MKPKSKREKSTTSVGHYVRNADLLPAVIEAKQLGKVTDKLIKMIEMIADRYSRKHNFGGYSFREDMVSSAVENLCKNALKFNHEKYNNPFAFYTTAIHHSFLQFMAEEKKHRNIRDKMLLDAGSNPSFNFLDEEKDESFFEVKESDELIISDMEISIDEESATTEELADPTDPLANLPVEIVPEGQEVKAPKEIKLRYRDRVPGPVTRYGPGDFDVDPVTGAFILKPKQEAVLEVTAAQSVKKPVTKKAVAKKAVAAPAAKKAVAKKAETKKPAAKKAVAKAPAKKAAAKKPATKAPAKKPAAKNPAAKKPAAKKTASKKTAK